jgi:cell division protein FtsN
MDGVPLPGATGRWIINLASYAGPKTASRMQQKFEALGVSTEKQVAEVNGATMYRLRIAAFESRGDAEAYFDSIKDTLGLESAWITKK